MSGGTSTLQRSWAWKQRVRNTQPLGGLIGLGRSPSSTIRDRPFCNLGSGIGTADSSEWVYGWSGAA
jgi:hypothetical protein